jgi:small subunit ribosomal protein S20
LGTWKAIVKADITPLTPKRLAATTSRASPSSRESPVAKEKKAVLRASRRPCPRRIGASAPALGTSVATRYTGPPPRRIPGRGVGAYMANIPSQEKRILRAERERLENRRRTSQVKTWFRRLENAVGERDAARTDAEYRSLVSRIDKAVKSGALHRNNGARKKSRAARIRSGVS